ncbi:MULTISPECIES: hypothetical protein [Streptomycetaceae]|uniref:hypothetical protein n=1 Tax=Streptomycetaceae TaxID=2062 RepID=UPI000B28CE7F|nr:MULTISPECIES: hypothetical protein [Streptomycetaceae]MYS61143.1 hypothetical protein [Streptomyces sp. SID5468]
MTKSAIRNIFSAISLTAVTAVAVAAAPEASAAQSPNGDPCAGKSATSIVKNYYRGPLIVPLRCGTSSWGYRHLAPKHEFNDSMIAQTVSRGNQMFGFYYLNLNQCPAMMFKVVFNDGALGGTGVRPQGVITAYYQEGHMMKAAC